MIKIVLADDHTMVRQGFRALLESEPEFFIAGEASDGLRALELVEQLHPDVLIVDLFMPGLPGLEVVRQVSDTAPATRTIVLTMYSDEAYVLEALRSGAVAYVLKQAEGQELVRAIYRAIEGLSYLSPPLSEEAIKGYIDRATAVSLDKYDTLTRRERQVYALVAQGYTSQQMAAGLGIGARTVETHRANMMRKMGFKSQVELTRDALRRGILRMDD